jgi:hypothetical protein
MIIFLIFISFLTLFLQLLINEKKKNKHFILY